MISFGYYFKNSGNHYKGDQWVGIGMLLATFILMPLFIYHRWKDKKVKNYMLTQENIEKMNAFNEGEGNKKK